MSPAALANNRLITMNSPKTSPRPAPRNPKLSAMTSIASRSPNHKPELSANSMASKKLLERQLIDEAPYKSQKAESQYPRQSTRSPFVERPSARSTSQRVEASKIVNLPNGDRYEGPLMGGCYHGVGVYVFKDLGVRYEGQFSQGKQHGQGALVQQGSKEPIYEGGWQFGLKHGQGRYTFGRDEYYNGEWVDDQKDGAGIYTFPGGIYNGSWSKGRREGKGSLKLTGGPEFKGSFENNQFVRGLVKYQNGDEYSGEMKDNLRAGEEGSYMQSASKIMYRGGWLNDKKHGRGTLTYENGDELTGTFSGGELSQDHVVMYKWRDGTVFNGWFRGNQPNKGTVSRSNGQKWEI